MGATPTIYARSRDRWRAYTSNIKASQIFSTMSRIFSFTEIHTIWGTALCEAPMNNINDDTEEDSIPSKESFSRYISKDTSLS
jgi:hypothetical protein